MAESQDVADLEARIARLLAENAELRADSKAPTWDKFHAAQAAAERSGDRLRAVTQTLIACVGSDGPEDAESAAERTVREVARLRAALARIEDKVDQGSAGVGVLVGGAGGWPPGYPGPVRFDARYDAAVDAAGNKPSPSDEDIVELYQRLHRDSSITRGEACQLFRNLFNQKG